MKKYKMKCGHVSNAVTSDNIPCCVICGCTEVEREVKEKEGLEGRKAKCPYCKKTTDSDWRLAFFEHKPDSEYDEYYDGCFGWD